MAISLSSPVTGGAQTGFTSPTYTLAVDNPPNATTGKQWNVTAVGGTQTGVRVHSISDPFTITFERPSVLKTFTFAMLNAMTGLLGQVPFNVYTYCKVRKGVNVAASNPPRIMEIDCKARIPAGSDSYDPANIRAASSLFAGAVWQIPAGTGDTLVTGTL
uniref:Uncharacterized protein n=1 Tax=Leviviridae sp. TaxID=2027243 RepID=A0A514D2G2_9VIRU|nr:MAG: hypothetical protein H4BulkLitter231573_000002 [Leviviridae sp.]